MGEAEYHYRRLYQRLEALGPAAQVRVLHAAGVAPYHLGPTFDLDTSLAKAGEQAARHDDSGTRLAVVLRKLWAAVNYETKRPLRNPYPEPTT